MGGEKIENPYKPLLARIKNIKTETTGPRSIKTFQLRFIENKIQKKFSFKPGQCMMLSLFGVGECMFAISSSPTQKKFFEVSVMKHGKVTTAIHNLKNSEIVGVRGPYGNSFDVEKWKNKNIVTIGGGIGQAPLRSLINYVLDKPDKYEKLKIFYGARSSKDLCYMDELNNIGKKKNVDVFLSVDEKEEKWKDFTGFVPDNLIKVKPKSKNSVAITCGPPVMMPYVFKNLKTLGFNDENIFTTLEMRMKCGIGICGRCNIGNIYVCKDGPVFSYAQLKNLQGER